MSVGYVKGIIEVSCKKKEFSCDIIADCSEILHRNAVCNYDSVVLRQSSEDTCSDVLAVKLTEGNKIACTFNKSYVSKYILVGLALRRKSIYWELEKNAEQLEIIGFKIADD